MLQTGTQDEQLTKYNSPGHHCNLHRQGMAIFLKNTTFHGILLDALFEAGGDCADKAAVVRCVSEGIANGAVRPLPSTVFSDQQLEQAFR